MEIEGPEKMDKITITPEKLVETKCCVSTGKASS
jgi:hypothetical protein